MISFTVIKAAKVTNLCPPGRQLNLDFTILRRIIVQPTPHSNEQETQVDIGDNRYCHFWTCPLLLHRISPNHDRNGRKDHVLLRLRDGA